MRLREGVVLAILLFGTVVLGEKCSVCADVWGNVDSVLVDAVQDAAFPGAVAVVLDKDGILYRRSVGRYTYGDPPPLNGGDVPRMRESTLFDMASVTKVLAATSAAALLHQEGELRLDERVSDILGSEFSSQGKGRITIENLLLHNAGFPPDPSPNYWDAAFGCAQTKREFPRETFSCEPMIIASLLNQTLAHPVGQTYVYSDLSFITLMYSLGARIRARGLVPDTALRDECRFPTQGAALACYYEAFVRTRVFEALRMHDTGYLPDARVRPRAAPCENETLPLPHGSYLHRTPQGQVSDGNAYAMGGISGHAGLFSTANDVVLLAREVMFEHRLLTAETMALFSKVHNPKQSSRALGWNTNINGVFDEGWNHTCGDLSPQTFLHIGYTGTQLCNDPIRGVSTILLTNRVYPTDANRKIERVRQLYNDAVVQALDKLENDGTRSTCDRHCTLEARAHFKK